MPYTTGYRNNTSLYRNWSGTVTSKELLDSLDEIIDDVTNGQKIYKSFYDATSVSKFDGSIKDVIKYAYKCLGMSKLTPDVYMAVVVPHVHIFGLVRVWATYVNTTSWVIQIFHNRNDAEEWLNSF